MRFHVVGEIQIQWFEILFGFLRLFRRSIAARSVAAVLLLPYDFYDLVLAGSIFVRAKVQRIKFLKLDTS